VKAPQAKTGKSKTAKSKPPVPTFSPHEWVPLKDALAHIKVTIGEFTLAVRRFYQDALDGRLVTALVEILPDGTEKVTFPKPSDWRQWKVRVPKLNEESAYVTLVGGIEIVSGHFFVRRTDLDKHYPIAATPTVARAAETHERQKPGTKYRDDWPMVMAAEVIRLAVRDPEMLQNVDWLVRHMRKEFLPAELGWAPSDPKAVRKLLVALLRFVRR